MATKIITWDEKQARLELSKRLSHASDARRIYEPRWENNEYTIYNTRGPNSQPLWAGFSEGDMPGDSVDSSDSDISVSYSFKNLRYIHAQLSANPPSVIARPTSNDQEDRQRADAADRLVRHAIRKYNLQEVIDKVSLHTLLYGTGFLRLSWDSELGEPIDVDEDGNILLEGDVSFRSVSPWHIWVDPDCDQWSDCRFVFERTYVPFEEAVAKFGEEKRDILEKCRIRDGGSGVSPSGIEFSTSSMLRNDKKYDVVEIYEYWEKGLPTNGFLGRHCYCTQRGELLTELEPSPHRFRKMGAVSRIMSNDNLPDEIKEARVKRLPQIAELPYHIFTDVDVPEKVWGRSFIEYVNRLQDVLNRLDSTTLDAIQAHAVTRIILPEGAEIAEDSITNSNWEVVKIAGNQPPFKMEPPGPMPLVDNFRMSVKMGIDDMSGVNEAMFGQQSREQSNAAMQYATNQGNMIRRRLFNKYVMFVEGAFRSYLNLIRKHWELPRIVAVLGKEKALESVEIKGADIDGGYDLLVEYGTSLSLDPITRREEILALQPMFEKAGVPPRVSLKMMKLNELEGMYDLMQMAEDRQREIYEEIIATGRYVAPEELQDHENMIAYSLQYFMTTEFKYLPEEIKQLCRQHTKDRALQAAKEKQSLSQESGSQLPGGPMSPGPAPAGPAGAPPTGATPPEFLGG
jgi:hypothetical protein